VNDFRYKISLLGEDIAAKRSKMSLTDKILYQYPPKLANDDKIPDTVKHYLIEDRNFLIQTLLSNDDFKGSTLEVSCFMKPKELIGLIMQKSSAKMKSQYEGSENYILKICGQEEYIFGDNPLIQFLYIQDMLSCGEKPKVVLKYVNEVYVFTSSYIPTPEISLPAKKSDLNKPTSTLRKKNKTRSSWDITDNFEITINEIRNVNVFINKSMDVGIQVGLYHGGKSLCEKQKTKEKTVNDKGIVDFFQTLNFDIKLQNIPRMARICLVLYEKAKNQKHMRSRRIKDSQKDIFINPIAWANTTVYDYKHQLKTGGITLYTWSYAEDTDSEELIHPLGTVEPNPRISECVSITLHLYDYDSEGAIILHPTDKEMIAYAERNLQKITRPYVYDSSFDILQPYAHNDRLNEISIQEKDEIWDRRFDLMKHQPEAIPSLLYCVEWNNRDKVAEVTRILNEWPHTIRIEKTLELLDYAYPDPNVRRYAVKCLNHIKDEDLQLYLLQLVQAIKHESYLYCDLVKFLLLKALSNQRIGHFLFWHLRSEIQMPSVQVRFSLILEAYLRSSREHISILTRQLNCLEKLRSGSEQIKKIGKEKAKQKLMDFLCSAKGE
jgi:phosphatidylinositol-4,5-bisphosphate 3-kinase catalytic subunit alpha/beta/delta